ncbi:Fe-S cluster assembly ATPase SufC [Candidatus Woesearchaeota archaeon]|nr:Fe-S cluster assembly ATPase SufC [Candidatus Woesearchaeota archaeon]
METLKIKNLSVSTDGKKILENVNLEIKRGEIVALMGPNGSGKSTLAYAIMGHPNYTVESGEVLYKNQNILELSPDKRAKLGIFLSFQYPSEVPGVSVSNFLRTAFNNLKNVKVDVMEFLKKINQKMELLNIDKSFIQRHLNDGFSGGEKKKCEILQMAVFEPEIAILDETDSGTDVDALRVIGEGVNKIKEISNSGILVITHYNRILKYLKPDRVYIMMKGKIVKEGEHKLADEIESKGYKIVN